MSSLELVQIVERLYVCDESIVAVSLRLNYHITLGLESEKPTGLSVESCSSITETLFANEEGRRDSLPSVYKVYLLPPLKR